jgi:hypothetical protein
MNNPVPFTETRFTIKITIPQRENSQLQDVNTQVHEQKLQISLLQSQTM